MDTIADFLTRIRNASLAKHDKVDVPSSNIRVGIAQVLKDAGYIENFKVVKDGKQGTMRLYLSYDGSGKCKITNIKRASTPGRRLYVAHDKIPNPRSGYGMSILSTNKGIMSGKAAIQNRVGGELICTVW
jgi:small subunit ribosomal protein S8